MQSKAITALGSWLTNKSCPGAVINGSRFFHSILEAVVSFKDQLTHPTLNLDLQQLPDCPNDVHFAAASTISQAMLFCEEVEANRELALTLLKAALGTVVAFDHAVAAEDVDK